MNADKLFSIVSNEKFLKMEGLTNEVPFFVYAYDIRKQKEMYQRILSLKKRLETSGIKPLCIGLYDMVIGAFEEAGELEDLFEFETTAGKEDFLQQLASYINPDDFLKPYFLNRLKEDTYQLMFVYQVGEVFPFLRSHNLLNNLQSTVRNTPLILFFPGEYITSYEHGFELKLFGKFKGPYYRAFKLEDYVVRGNIDGELT